MELSSREYASKVTLKDPAPGMAAWLAQTGPSLGSGHPHTGTADAALTAHMSYSVQITRPGPTKSPESVGTGMGMKDEGGFDLCIN